MSNKYEFKTEEELKKFIADRLAKIRKLFAEVTAAEESFYGHSPARDTADAMKRGAMQ